MGKQTNRLLRNGRRAGTAAATRGQTRADGERRQATGRVTRDRQKETPLKTAKSSRDETGREKNVSTQTGDYERG